MTHNLRLATTADIPLIREVTMQVWPQTYTPIVGPEQVAYMLAKFYDPEALAQQMATGHTFALCYSDGQAAAFASWSEMAPGIFKLHKLYILPGEQGKGIGRYLLEYIARELTGKGAAALRLNVNRYNTPAIAFYDKLGFRRLEDEDIDIGNGYFMNDHVLELLLQ